MSAPASFVNSASAESGLPGSLAGFRNRHKGGSIVVCGCGESLNRLTDPGRFVTIGVNDVGRRFDPDYLVVLNPKSQFSPERFQFIERTRAAAVFTQLHLPIRHPNIVRFRLGRFAGTDFSDPNVLHYTRNSPYVALCLAVHMGATRIGLIGVDFTDHHFFKKSGRHPLAHRLNAINKEYEKLYSVCCEMGVEIVNLSPESRIYAFERTTPDAFSAACTSEPAPTAARALNIVSYATTPLAGVPDILARCIQETTVHRAECVWETGGFANGVVYTSSGTEWRRTPDVALEKLRAADLIVVHNGKVHPRHRRVVEGMPVITMAHNYLWNVDDRFVRCGMPGVVVGQYQATLDEFKDWSVVPNPVPLGETAYQPAAKPDRIGICYTPSGRHESYPRNHRLYWHAKGYKSTMRVLEALAARYPVDLHVVRHRQYSHAEVLAMKRRSHIVIDECVTGGYHRNSLEGLAAGCVVVNGFGLLDGIDAVFDFCTEAGAGVPFVSCGLGQLEGILAGLIELGPEELARRGAANRRWLERHWSFDRQWRRYWQPLVDRAVSSSITGDRVSIAGDRPVETQPDTPAGQGVSVVIPHSGRERFDNLVTTLHRLQQCEYVGETIVVESGTAPECFERIKNLCSRYVFVYNDGVFQRGQTLNIGSGLSRCDYILWLDNDLLADERFVREAVDEMERRRLDFLVPYAAIRYLSKADSRDVIEGAASIDRCKPFKVLRSGRDVIGGAGLVRRRFYLEHGGFESGFRGWGGEDNAWHIKARLFGRMAVSQRPAQCLYHLYHENSGANNNGVSSIQSNPHYADNLALLERVRHTRSPAEYKKRFPPQPYISPWRTGQRPMFVVDACGDFRRKYVEPLAGRLGEIYGVEIAVRSPGDVDDARYGADEVLYVVFSVGDGFRRECGRRRGLLRRALWVYCHEPGGALHHFLELEPEAAAVMPFDPASAAALSFAPERSRRYPSPLLGDDTDGAVNLACAASLVAGGGTGAPVGDHTPPALSVWVYWEGDCPEWIRECHKTIRKHAPGLRLLDAESFDRLWYKDRDIDLGRLPLALKADYIRAFLLAHYGGLWIDSDCLVMRPLDDLLEKLRTTAFLAHRERSGLVSNAFIGACYGSALAREYYRRVCDVLRASRGLGWTSLGSAPLTGLLDDTTTDWHELDCEAVQPVCWSRPETFFQRAAPEKHRAALRGASLCYMLSHDRIRRYTREHHGRRLLEEGTFFRFLLDCALQDTADGDRGTAMPAAITGGPENMRRVFREIYRDQCASNPESVSGPGSCLARTKVVRRRLPGLFSTLGVRHVLDAGCGDFHWFREIAPCLETYIGVDVVPELIEANRERYASASVAFEARNAAVDPLPTVDLVIARDWLVHLPFEAIVRALRNVQASGSRYLLMTTFTRPRNNRDIGTGDWRPLNFLRPPFCLPSPLELINEHCDEAGGRYNDKSLGLWAIEGLSLPG